ncbi:MAG: ydaF [Acidobacteria bacterium]|nr:ydaF [Acidobacteriota bacterium]
MPSIETARLYLRMFRDEDLDQLVTLLADADVVRYVGNGLPIPREESENALHSIIRHWDNHGFGRWAIIDKEAREFIGFGGLRSLLGTPEVVYHLAKRYWGRGLATEIARASLRFGFEDRKFDRIVAVAKPDNAASIHVMEKAGMKFEMNTSYYDIDVVQYRINRSEFSIDNSPYTLLRESAG